MVAKSDSVHSTVTGDGPPVMLMHGLFGSGSNLGALARHLSEHYRVYSLDLPNHGKSAWLDGTGPAELGKVISRWMEKKGIAAAGMVGHSLGGKVAMEIALDSPWRVTSLVVADIAPVSYSPHHDAIFRALGAVAGSECASRAEAAELMSTYLDEPAVVQFLLTSLQRQDSGLYRWRFNLQGIERDYASVLAAPTAGRRYTGPVLFVKGGASDYILPQHRDRVHTLFPNAIMKEMPGCGHWLHAEKPKLFNSIVGRFLDSRMQVEAG